MKTKFNFTQATLVNLAIPSKSEKHYIVRDSSQRGLILMVNYGGTKTFYFRTKFKRKKTMIKIGVFPYIDVETARSKAFSLYSGIRNGDLQQNKLVLTLNELFFDEYLPKYAKIFKKSHTWQENERVFNRHFVALKDKNISELDRNTIDTWHKSIGKNNGVYMANRCLALMRHMLNMAIDWGFMQTNPATHIKQYREIARDRFLQPDEIHNFISALQTSENTQLKHFILLLLFTGQRKSNILSLRWENVNLCNNILYLPDTKNNQPQQIPLTQQAIDVLNDIGIKNSGWVFPSDNSKSGHLENPKRFWQQVTRIANIHNLRMHDLRRTMGSYQAIMGSSMNIIGKSLGHKSLQSTEVYARLSLAPVRDSMQKATDEILKY